MPENANISVRDGDSRALEGFLSSARIAVIGGGKMGEAVIAGWIAAERGSARYLAPSNFIVANPGEQRRAYLESAYGVSCVADPREIDRADVVILAVKPQVMIGILESIAPLGAYSGGRCGPLFVSVAAGLSVARLESALASGSRVVRTMPNTPLLAGCGVTAVAGGACATAEDVALVHDLFACLGMACVVDEDAIDVIGAISGSGPAYVAALIEALRDAGARLGLASQLAEKLAFETVRGTAELMVRTGEGAESTRIAVCSPKGTTLAALSAMEEAGFSASIDAGVAAAVRRSKELAAC